MIPAMAMAAAMAFPMLMISVMIALYIRIVCKRSFRQSLNRFISAAGHTAIKTDSSIGQSILRSHADASADQSIHLQVQKKACQGSMAVSVRVYDLFFCNLSIF